MGMKILSGAEEKEALVFLMEAAEAARDSQCHRSFCGAVIVQGHQIIGKGSNSPPLGSEKNRRCQIPKTSYNPKVTDKTCCMHAEQRAIFDALQKNSLLLPGAQLYFIRLDKEKKITKAGKPYCTICSKIALDVGIAEFILWHDASITAYNTEEYNHLSYQYQE